MAYSVKDGDLGTGGPHPSLALGFSHTTKEAQNLFASIDTSETYAGWHACCFYPAGFELLALKLARLGGTDWCMERVIQNAGRAFEGEWSCAVPCPHVGHLTADQHDYHRNR
jgi:hypothetical protein